MASNTEKTSHAPPAFDVPRPLLGRGQQPAITGRPGREDDRPLCEGLRPTGTSLDPVPVRCTPARSPAR